MPKKIKKPTRNNRIFYFGFALAIILAVVVLSASIRSFSQNENCGCPTIDLKSNGSFDSSAKIAYFDNLPLDYEFKEIPPDPRSLALAQGAVLGATTDERWIEVDLSDQHLYAHEGNRVVYDFLISSGKWARTPTGDFQIWIKMKYTKMSGGSKELHTYYYLPNVPYVMYFYKDYGLHGTYWHNNFGHPMSHGCINLATPDAERLFYWTSPVLPENTSSIRASKDNPGTRVIIHD